MNEFDAAVIGSGPAGLTAAIYLRRANKSVVVFERTAAGGQLAAVPTVENYPGSVSDSGFEIADKMRLQAEEFGATLIMEPIVRADLKEKTLFTPTSSYGAKVIIIATGALPGKLGLKEEESLHGAGVSYCAVCDAGFHKGRPVMLVGNTWRAKHDLTYLCGVCSKVYYVTPSDYDGEIFDNAEIIERALPVRLNGHPLTSVVVSQEGREREIAVEALFVDIGFLPQSLPFKGQVETDETGFILTDEYMRASLPGVYAVGDVRKKTLRQVVTATADGAVAANDCLKLLSKKRTAVK